MAKTSHKTLLAIHVRHAERIFDKSHSLCDERREALFKRVIRDTSHRVTQRLHRLENKSVDNVQPIVKERPVEDRDVKADIYLKELVTLKGELCMRGILLNYPVDAIIGSVVNTLPVRRGFRYRSFTYIETELNGRGRWYRIHGDIHLLNTIGIEIPKYLDT